MSESDNLQAQAATTVGPTTPFPIYTTTTTLAPCERSCLWMWVNPNPKPFFKNSNKPYWKLLVDPCGTGANQSCPCLAPSTEGLYHGQETTTLCGGERPSGPASPCNRYCTWMASYSTGNWDVVSNPCPNECPCPKPKFQAAIEHPNPQYAATWCGQGQEPFLGSTTTPIPLASCAGSSCTWRSVQYSTYPLTFKWHLRTGCSGNPLAQSVCSCQPPNNDPASEGLEQTTSCSGPVACSGECTWTYYGLFWLSHGTCQDCYCGWPYNKSELRGAVTGDTVPGICYKNQSKPVIDTCNGNCAFKWVVPYQEYGLLNNPQGYWQQMTSCQNTCQGCSFPNFHGGNQPQITHTECIPNTGTPTPGIPAEPAPIDCRGTCVYNYKLGSGLNNPIYVLDSKNTTCNYFCGACPPVLSSLYQGLVLTKECIVQDTFLTPSAPTENCTGNCVYDWSDYSNKYTLNDTQTTCKNYSDCYPCWAVLNVTYRGKRIAVPCSGRTVYETTTTPPPVNPIQICRGLGCRYKWNNNGEKTDLFGILNGYWEKIQDFCYSNLSNYRCICPFKPNVPYTQGYTNGGEKFLELECKSSFIVGVGSFNINFDMSFDMSSITIEI